MNRYEKHVQVLQGLPVQRIGRAADLVWVMFCALRPRRVPRHADDVIGEWAVHIQCAWRFSHGDGIDSGSARRGKRSKLKGRSPRQPRCLRDRVGRGPGVLPRSDFRGCPYGGKQDGDSRGFNSRPAERSPSSLLRACRQLHRPFFVGNNAFEPPRNFLAKLRITRHGIVHNRNRRTRSSNSQRERTACQGWLLHYRNLLHVGPPDKFAAIRADQRTPFVIGLDSTRPRCSTRPSPESRGSARQMTPPPRIQPTFPPYRSPLLRWSPSFHRRHSTLLALWRLLNRDGRKCEAQNHKRRTRHSRHDPEKGPRSR